MKLQPETTVEPRRMPQWMAWLLGCAFSVALFVRDLRTFDHGRILGGDFWGRDFMNAWTGGHLVRSGRIDVLNDVSAYGAYMQSLFGHLDPHNYSYPPVSYPLSAALSLLPYWLALSVWLAGTGALFVYACRRWWPRTAGPSWLAVLTPAALLNIWDGQYGFLIGALFLLGWQWLDERPVRAGVAFGLMLLKPHIAILVPIILLARGEWKAIGSAAATVIGLVAGSILLFGIEPWQHFIFHTGVGQVSMVDANHAFYSFLATSTATAVMELGVGRLPGILIHAVVATAAVLAVCVATIRRMPTRQLAFFAATCTFIVLPYGFNYDLTVVCVGALMLMNTAGVNGQEYRAGFYGFMCPQLGMIAAMIGLPLMPIMLIALAAAQFHCWLLRPQSETAIQLPASLEGLASPQHS